MHPFWKIAAVVAGLFSAFAVVAEAMPARASDTPPQQQARDRFLVTVRGTGPDVILIPGLASDARVWARTVEGLEDGHRVHVVQVKGFAGAAPGANGEGAVVAPLAEALAAYIASEGLERPAVIGHSMGGVTALMLADRHPDRVGRVMVVDALPFFSVLLDPGATAESVAPRAAGLRDMMIGMDAAAFAAGQERTAATLVKDAAARKEVLDWSLASDRGTMARAMYDVMTTDLRPRLAGIRTPVTVLYARDDAMGPGAAFVEPLYQANYAALPDRRLVRVDGAFHFIMLDQPERFAAEVEAFLK